MPILPFLKVFRITPEGQLSSLHASAPWARRIYTPHKWNHDNLGIWVYPLWGTGLFDAITDEAAVYHWEIWACYGSLPFRPLFTHEAMESHSSKPPASMNPLATAMAVKHLYPLTRLIHSHEFKFLQEGRALLLERVKELLSTTMFELPKEVPSCGR